MTRCLTASSFSAPISKHSNAFIPSTSVPIAFSSSTSVPMPSVPLHLFQCLHFLYICSCPNAFSNCSNAFSNCSSTSVPMHSVSLSLFQLRLVSLLHRFCTFTGFANPVAPSARGIKRGRRNAKHHSTEEFFLLPETGPSWGIHLQQCREVDS